MVFSPTAEASEQGQATFAEASAAVEAVSEDS